MSRLFTRTFLVATSLVLAGPAHATTINLLTNGSFETGLTGWTTTGGGTYPIAAVTLGTPCCFGETVPLDNIVGGSPDAAGTKGVYFVDDAAHQVLSQSLFLGVGKYDIGFDAYAPFNGYGNAGDAAFTATIAGVQLANYTVKTSVAGLWLHFSGLADVQTAGIYNVTFDFQPAGGASADVVIDRVFIGPSSSTSGGTPIGGGPPAAVPEPATLLLLGTGLALTVVRLRRKGSV